MIVIAIAIGPVLASGDESAATVLAGVMIALLLGAIAPALAARRRVSSDASSPEVPA